MTRPALAASRRRAAWKFHGQASRTRLLARRPAVESLEGRALMSVGGGPDFSFGDDGTTTTGFPATATLTSTASVLQPNGDLVVVGEEQTLVENPRSAGSSGPGPVTLTIGFSARRYLPNGTLDPTFDDTGLFFVGQISTTYGDLEQIPPAYSTATGVALTSTGQILVVGDFNNNAALLRLNSNGGLDPTFGQGGVVVLGSESSESPIEYASTVAALPGGLIAVGGATNSEGDPGVEVFNSDGSVDTSYGTGGLAVVPLPANASRFVQIVPGIDGGTNSYSTSSPVTMAVQTDGSIVLTGNAMLPNGYSSEIVATRFTPGGAVDTGFGTGGDAIISATSILPEATAVSGSAIALEPDGNILIGGSIDAFGNFGRQVIVELDPAGQPDASFGQDGAVVPGGSDPVQGSYVAAIAVQPDGKVLLADGFTSDFVRLDTDGMPDLTFGVDGTAIDDADAIERLPIALDITIGQPPTFGPGAVGVAVTSTNTILVSQDYGDLSQLLEVGAPDDFTEGGRSDPSIYVASSGLFGYLAPGEPIGAEYLPIGSAGPLGEILPAPGAYDGYGIDEAAVYNAQLGEFVIQPYYASPAGATSTLVTIPFGLPDYQTLPAPGDYTGSGTTQVGVYDAGTGIYAYRPGGTGPDVYVQIGGTDPQSIPVPGDYFGTGRDDVAIYEPTKATFLIQDPANGQIISIPFGAQGLGNSIPVPGDYDGSGKTELAVYLPNQAEFIYRPADGGSDVTMPFGVPGIGGTLPAPGDYDGSGHLEVGGYLEASGIFAYRPADAPDVDLNVGTPYQTLPYNLASATDATTLIPIIDYPESAEAPATTSGSAEIPLTPDVLEATAPTLAKKNPGLA